VPRRSTLAGSGTLVVALKVMSRVDVLLKMRFPIVVWCCSELQHGNPLPVMGPIAVARPYPKKAAFDVNSMWVKSGKVPIDTTGRLEAPSERRRISAALMLYVEKTPTVSVIVAVPTPAMFTVAVPMFIRRPKVPRSPGAGATPDVSAVSVSVTVLFVNVVAPSDPDATADCTYVMEFALAGT
jgi:hypothetical protein